MNRQDLAAVLETIRRAVPRGWILMSPNSLGEVVMSCAFARALQESSGYPVTLCVRPEHVPMVHTLYPNRMQAVVGMSMELMRAFSTTGFIPPNHHDIDFPINLSPLHVFDGYLAWMLDLICARNGRSGLTFSDVWRVMLRLDRDACAERPCTEYFNGPNAAFAAAGLCPGSYVIFQPGNNTNIPVPAKFWRTLEELYLREGLSVIVNGRGSMLVDRSLVFRQAVVVDLDVVDALYFARHSAAVVSGTNGLLFPSVFAEYKSQLRPVFHALSTDKYCKYYDKLQSDWNNAFVPFKGVPAIRRQVPEMVAESCHLMEWLIPSNLSEDTYAEAALAVYEMNKSSDRYLDLPVSASSDFPKVLEFGGPKA